MYLNLLFIVLIFNFLPVGEATKSIFISEDIISPTLTKVTCTISDSQGIKGTTFLHCPILDSDICYQGCTPMCKYENENCLVPSEMKSITKCDHKIEEIDHVRYQFTINVEKIKKRNGEWYCSYEGINSRPITLKVFQVTNNNIVTTITKTKLTSLSTKSATKKVLPIGVSRQVTTAGSAKITFRLSERVPETAVKSQVKTNDSEFNFRIFITKYEVVVGIIIFLSLSIFLNFVFCIRDSLIKQFIDNIKSNVSSNKYLLCCICQNELEGISATAKLDRILSKDPDYISTDASNCSKNDLYNNDIQRPLISPLYSNVDVNSNYTPNITRSSSIMNPEIAQNMVPVNYDQIYLTAPRGMSPYVYNPYIMTRSNIAAHERLAEYANQRHSYVLPSNFNLQSCAPVFQNPPSKKHASQNDIDLIRHCESQDQPPKVSDPINA